MSIQISGDGRRVIYGSDAQPIVEIWALENLPAQPVARESWRGAAISRRPKFLRKVGHRAGMRKS